MISLFNRLYVKNGHFPADFSRWLRRAFDLRTRCDTVPMAAVSADEAAESVAHVAQVVERVKAEMEPFTGPL